MVWSWLPLTLERLTGIEPWEVMQALTNSRRWPRPATSDYSGMRVLTIWARTRAGRGLLVALRPLDGRDWEIIAVRLLTADELDELQKWRKTVADLENFDPETFLAGLVFDPPGTPLDMPVPPLLGEDEQIIVHRTIDLPTATDARLRATAAAHGMTLEEYIRTWAENAA